MENSINDSSSSR